MCLPELEVESVVVVVTSTVASSEVESAVIVATSTVASSVHLKKIYHFNSLAEKSVFNL